MDGLLGGPTPYEVLAELLGHMLPEADRKRLFQVDLVKPVTHATLGATVVEQVRATVELLRGLFGGRSFAVLGPFIEAFTRRYGTREVPLLEALDPEAGIGFPAGPQAPGPGEPLLEGIAFQPPEDDPGTPWLPLHGFLLEKVRASIADGQSPILLDQHDVKPYLLQEPLPLPDAFSVLIRLADRGQGAFEAMLSSGVWGPSGACMLGRFCHGDPLLAQAVRSYLAQEEALRPQAVFAEVVHLPNDRSGNVLLRPILRRYEIPFLGRSGAPSARQIPVHDLMVSLQGEHIVLRSARLGKEVLPRLTSAQNFELLSLPIYRFLCSLQYQGVCNPGWDWGPLAGLPFLPRVLLRGVVVAPATWNLECASLKEVFALHGEVRDSTFKAWVRTRRLPRWVLLADGDQKLPVDLQNILSAETFLDLIRPRDRFKLEEMAPGPSAQGVQGPEGGFTHEIVLPFLAPPSPPSPQTSSPAKEPPSGPRTFPPGSEWLYAKLYTGEAGVDQLLREWLGPMVKDFMAEGSVDRWWFIRYGDPDWHLRVRFHGEPQALSGVVLPELHRRLQPFLARNVVWKVQLDTYERELERYGAGAEMEAAEQVFHADSDTALALLKAFPGESGTQVRWRLALMGMDALLGDLGFTLTDKAGLMELLRASHAQVLGGRAWSSQVGERFRKERASLRALLDPKAPLGPLSEGRELLRARSRALKPIGIDFTQMPGPIRQDRAASFLHLSANRLLRSAHRAQEAILYDFLNRLYREERAKEGQRPPSTQEPTVTFGAITDHER